ncbi:MAG: DUF5916 domain-containing protein [Gemmatimonadales bacterium]
MLLLALLLQVSPPPPPPAPTAPALVDTSLLRHADGRVARTVAAARTPRAPQLDGRLTEAAWTLASPATGFTQMDPHEGQPASESTMVYIVYDDVAIYVGARLWDSEPHRVERRLSRRDGFVESDKFFVNFDSYHDHRSAFEFAVTPAGVKQDDITSNDFFFGDRSWDPVWDVATTVDSLGWTVEMRIPFSQLRFPPVREQLWGVQFFRTVFRKNEQTMFEFKRKDETGYASRFAHLVGLRDIPPPKRLEVLPYTVARGTHHRQDDLADPFDDGSVYFGGAGLDVKYGVTSNLTLDATFNPDFGQVEADPAVVNLTAFELSFEERRPFFVEGANIFEYGPSGGFIFFGGTPRMFYTRRIGRPPVLDVNAPSGGYVDAPGNSTILGAAKLSGRTAAGWSVGVLDAVTAREHATVDSAGVRRSIETEPLTNYFVGRLRREFGGGRSAVGILATAVNRDIETADLRRLRSQAYAAGIDFLHKWGNNAYAVTGSLELAHVRGDTLAIQATQRFPSRYYQRPDAQAFEYRPDRTSLTGVSADFTVNKEGGNTNWGIGGSTTTPGFEVNDLGFQTRVDRISAATFLGHRWTKPGKVFRQASVSFSTGPSWNYDGDPIQRSLSMFHFGQFLNYWGYNVFVNRTLQVLDDRLTRGGPATEEPAAWFGFIGFFSDGRQAVTGGGNASYNEDATGGWFLNLGPNLSVRPSGAVTLSVSPSYFTGRTTAQFVRAQTDAFATATYGRRYIFGTLRQRGVDVTVRLNLTMSPTLTFQLYAQPFTFAGNFGEFKELRAPRTFAFDVYGVDNGSTLTPGDPAVCGGAGPTECYGIDPDGGAGPAPGFALSNPDFRTRSLQSNAVLRWEYRPGSTLFLVWTQHRGSFVPYDPAFSARRDLVDELLLDRPTNVFLVKLNYWLSL